MTLLDESRFQALPWRQGGLLKGFTPNDDLHDPRDSMSLAGHHGRYRCAPDT